MGGWLFVHRSVSVGRAAIVAVGVAISFLVIWAPSASAQVPTIKAQASSTATSWSQLGGDSGHSGFDPSETSLGVQNAAAANIAWEATAQGFSSADPTIADGMAFIAADELDAVRVTDGTTAWTAAGDFGGGAPTVVGSSVVAGDGSGVLHAYNLATGAALWTRTVGTALPTLTSWAGGLVASTNAGRTVTSVSPVTGAVRWRGTVTGEVSGTAEESNTVVVTDSRGDVYGLNASTGSRMWETTVPDGGTLFVPTISGTSVYVDGPKAITSLQLSNGQVLWTNSKLTHPTNSSIEARPATDGHTVIVGLASGYLVALSSSAGRQLWAADAGEYVQAGTVAIANGVVWACNDRLAAFNLATGVLLKAIAIPTTACNSTDPAVADGSVYATVLNLDSYTHLIAVRLPSIKRYVALGDSVPYGHGLANPDKKTEGGLPPDMGPSPQAYPSLLAGSLGVKLPLRATGCKLTGDNLAVSGAPSIDNKWSGLNTNCHYSGTVPPHQAVDPDELDAANLETNPPQLVTIQVGADDIDFAGCLTHLLGIPRNPFSDSTNCVNTNSTGSYSLPPRVVTELASLTTGLDDIIAFIHNAAPSAKIVVLDYYQPVPQQSEILTGSSVVCRLLEAAQSLGNLAGERAKADFLQSELNQTIQAAANTYSYATFVDIGQLFSGHEMCVANPNKPSQSGSWLFDGVWDAAHPTQVGQEQIAAILESDF